MVISSFNSLYGIPSYFTGIEVKALAHFQFPLWDTEKIAEETRLQVYFQFPLWDTEILESVYKKEDITFNSLYGILNWTAKRLVKYETYLSIPFMGYIY